MEWSLFDIIRMTYRSHLLARTDRDFRELAEVSFETVRDRRSDEKGMLKIYKALNKACRFYSERGLRESISDYLMASEACEGLSMEWVGRKHSALRRRFLRGLFRKMYNPSGKFISASGDSADDPVDDALLKVFYPDGLDKDYTIDVLFVMLITFDIIKPLNPSAQRSRDLTVEDTEHSLREMIRLVELLREDYLEFQVVGKPIVFNLTLDILKGKLRNMDDEEERAQCTTNWYHFLLKNILDTCKGVSSPKNTLEAGIEVIGLRMPGIWIDDADKGENRFWIFPGNMQMAFCYSLHNGCWNLDPYEFVTSVENGEVQEVCTFISAAGDRQALFGKDHVINPAEIIYVPFRKGGESKDGLFRVIDFEPLGDTPAKWFNWRRFTRLEEDDPAFVRFEEAVREIYDGRSVQSLVLFENHGSFMTDVVDSLVGMDEDYIYVWDLPRPDRFILHLGSDGQFLYEGWYDGVVPVMNFLQIDISKKHPLYAIPRRVSCNKVIDVQAQRFIEAAASTSLDDTVCFYMISEPDTKFIYFNKYGVYAILDRDLPILESCGVRRITSRGEMGIVNG